MPVVNESTLKSALQEGQIVPYFQPLVDLSTGTVSGFEVLARWLHPVRGLVSPMEFIPMAERTGLIGELTEALLAQASVAATAWPKNLMLSVNISPLQLREVSLPERIRAAVQRGGFPLSRLILEITESALLEDLALVRPIAEELKAFGIRLALDDFGTGYSSLRYLHELPIDELKIDAGFVRSMTYQRESRKIVAAIIGLGRSLHLATVAEGIESQAQADMLRALGCDIGQGWLFGPPVPEDQIGHSLFRRAESQTTDLDFQGMPPEVTWGLEALPGDRLAQLQAIYHGVPAGLCFVDTNLRYISLNQRLAEISGIPASDYLGRTVAEVMPDMFKEVEPHLRRALSGEAITDLEVKRMMPGEREQRTYLVSYHPARDEANEVVGISVCAIDVTGRLRAEQEHRESEAAFSVIFESAPIGIALVDLAGQRLRSNPALRRILGFTEHELEGMSFPELTHPEDGEVETALYAELISGRRNHYEIEKRCLHREARFVWVKQAVSRASAPGGKHYAIGVIEDVTARRNAEESLRHLSGRFLKAQDEERRRIARELHDSVSQMQAMASLNLARVSTEYLGEEDRSALANCKVLMDASYRELRAVCYLLHPPLLEELGLESALRIYVEGFTQRSGIAVHVDVELGLTYLDIELELALFRVVQEALTNILRHSGSDLAEIRLTLDESLVLEIEDRGQGFPKESTSDAACICRLGVGIAGMRERIRQFGGTIQLLSADPGVIVRVTIPEASCKA